MPSGTRRPEIQPAGGQLSLDWSLDALEARVLCTLRAHVGRGAAIRVPQLAQVVYGLDYWGPAQKSCERALQSIVKRLREEHGQPILSTAGKPAGYYLAETADELLQCIQEQRRKAIHTLVMLRALKRHLARLRGQQEIAA